MRLLPIALLALSTTCFGDGPGTRILTTPSGPQRASPAAERDLQRCEQLRDEAKERCMKEVRNAAMADEKQRGPEATGAGSGAGSGASTGTSGAGASGAAGPR